MVRLGYGLGTAAIRGIDYKLRIESEINEAKEFSALSPRASDRIERKVRAVQDPFKGLGSSNYLLPSDVFGARRCMG